MKVRDIEARRAEAEQLCKDEGPESHEFALLALYSDVLTAIAHSGYYPPAAQAKAALGLPTNTKKGKP